MPIHVGTNTAGPAIPVGLAPVGVAFTPDGTTAYVANTGSGTVTPIDVATNRPGAPIRLPLGTGPFYVTFTPDGATAYVSGFVGGVVVPIDVAKRKAGAAIPVGLQADALLLTDDGATLYVTDFSSAMVTVVDTGTNGVTTAFFAGGIGPNGLALQP